MVGRPFDGRTRNVRTYPAQVSLQLVQQGGRLSRDPAPLILGQADLLQHCECACIVVLLGNEREVGADDQALGPGGVDELAEERGEVVVRPLLCGHSEPGRSLDVDVGEFLNEVQHLRLRLLAICERKVVQENVGPRPLLLRGVFQQSVQRRQVLRTRKQAGRQGEVCRDVEHGGDSRGVEAGRGLRQGGVDAQAFEGWHGSVQRAQGMCCVLGRAGGVGQADGEQTVGVGGARGAHVGVVEHVVDRLDDEGLVDGGGVHGGDQMLEGARDGGQRVVGVRGVGGVPDVDVGVDAGGGGHGGSSGGGGAGRGRGTGREEGSGSADGRAAERCGEGDGDVRRGKGQGAHRCKDANREASMERPGHDALVGDGDGIQWINGVIDVDGSVMIIFCGGPRHFGIEVSHDCSVDQPMKKFLILLVDKNLFVIRQTGTSIDIILWPSIWPGQQF